MSNETHDFSADGMLNATFRLGLENNAMLRMLISNQIKIMKHIGIPIDHPDHVYKDILPGMEVKEDEYTVMMEVMENVADMLQHRAWEWVQMNTNKGIET